MYYQLHLGYSITIGHNCGGESIYQWSNGSNSNYESAIGLPLCEKTCNLHEECAGFVHRLSDDVCGIWKKGPLNIYQSRGLNCHKKPKSNFLSFNI